MRQLLRSLFAFQNEWQKMAQVVLHVISVRLKYKTQITQLRIVRTKKKYIYVYKIRHFLRLEVNSDDFNNILINKKDT